MNVDASHTFRDFQVGFVLFGQCFLFMRLLSAQKEVTRGVLKAFILKRSFLLGNVKCGNVPRSIDWNSGSEPEALPAGRPRSTRSLGKGDPGELESGRCEFRK